jgi:tetratricopeptide (TPR) repeat protein
MLAYRNVGRATALPTHADTQIFAVPEVVPSSFLHDLVIRTAHPHNADISREAQRHRNFGNVAFLQGNLNEALECYTKGIDLCPHHHILRANRCVLYSLAGQVVPACIDAEAIVASLVVFQSVFEQTQHMLSLCHTSRMPVTQISTTLIDAIKLLNQGFLF